MQTWNAEAPPRLDPPTWPQKIRGAIRLALMIGCTMVSVLLFLLGRGLRAVLGRWIVFHFGVARAWSRVMLWLSGLSLEVRGAPISAGALVSNHSSWIDILALRSTRLMYFVSKAEVANWPGVGFITKITGTIFIERKRSHVKAQEAMLRSRIADNDLLTLFPEGTSTDGQRVLDFKSSLFSAFYTENGSGADLQIQAVSVRYTTADGDGVPVNFYGWWGTMGFESHIWDVVTRSTKGQVEVIFHTPINPSDFDDRKQLADYTQRQVAHGWQIRQPQP